MSQDWHVLPVDDLVDHEERGRRCWCQPRYALECEDCEGAGCWKCEDGVLYVTEGCPDSVVVVHNAADGRE